MSLVDDTMTKDWFPYGLDPDQSVFPLSSAWLPAEPEHDVELLDVLAQAWSGLEWVALATATR